MSLKISYARIQAGNALFYILIAVALIAALSYAVVQSSRGNVSQLDQERAKLLGSEIIEYGNIVANATGQLRLRGVSLENLCFDHPMWNSTDYDHAGCTQENHKIFSTAGGGVHWKEIPSQALLSDASGGAQKWLVTADNGIHNVGTTCNNNSCSEILLLAQRLGKNICIAINDALGINNPSDAPPIDSGFGTSFFTGSFSFASMIGDETSSSVLSTKTAGCFTVKGSPDNHVFYRVLISQ